MGRLFSTRLAGRQSGRLSVVLVLSGLTLWSAATREGRAAIVPAQRATAREPSSSLRLQTLNVFGLPWPLAPDVAARCRSIAGQILADDVDVIALQEAWDDSSCAAFSLPEHHRACCQLPAGLIGSTGLLTLSRHPIRSAENRYFAAEEGIERLVNKGVLRTIIVVPGGELDLWNLHLQSGIGDVATRRAQIDELLDWLRTADRTARAAVVGDFNCAPGDPEFTHLVAGMTALGFVHASCGRPTYDATANALAAPEQPREIDHIFVRCPAAAVAAIRVYDRPVGDLLPSDHFGVEAVISEQCEHALGDATEVRDDAEAHRPAARHRAAGVDRTAEAYASRR